LGRKGAKMKVGDLVKFETSKSLSIGLVIETGAYVGNKDVKVYWNGKDIRTEYSGILEVISETR
jgi:hypothetical protein